MIRTARLLMRRWRDDDRAPFGALNADPAVMEHMTTTLTREQSDAFMDRVDACWDERGFGLWAVEVPEVVPFIGYVGLSPADAEVGAGTVEVGWRLARDHWGNGYASEAAHEAMRFGFEQVGLDEIVSFTVPQNERSLRVMERIGLRRDPGGDFDHPRVDPVTHPELVRHVLYRIGHAEWERFARAGAGART